MPDIPIMGRSKSSFKKLIQQLPKELQKEAESLLHSILFKYEQDFFRNTDSGENSYTGKDGYFWGVDETNGESVLLENTATNVKTDVTNFNNILSSADTNVQLALDTIDNHTIDDHPIPFGTSLVSNTTISAATRIVRCNGTFTVTLPLASTATGLPITIKNVGTGVITIDANGSETIDGALTYILTPQYEAVTIVSDGVYWQVTQDHLRTELPELEVGDATNYLDIDTHGFLTLNGTATAWEDLRVPVTSTKLGGTSDPTFSKVKDDGSGSQGVFAYKFTTAKEEELYFTVQLPHSWKEGTKIWPHVHWCPEDDETGDPEPVIVWGLEYTWANIDDVLSNTTLITGTETGPFTAYTHTLTGIDTGIAGSGKTHSSMLLCRVYLDVSECTYTKDVFLFEIDFHFEVCRFGTDTNPSDP